MTHPAASLLENELVRKYLYGDDEFMANRVLAAMQEPIQRGERCLVMQNNGTCKEVEVGYEPSPFHPWYLRLPDKFQRTAEDCCDYAKYLKWQIPGVAIQSCEKHSLPPPPSDKCAAGSTHVMGLPHDCGFDKPSPPPSDKCSISGCDEDPTNHIHTGNPSPRAEFALEVEKGIKQLAAIAVLSDYNREKMEEEIRSLLRLALRGVGR